MRCWASPTLLLACLLVSGCTDGGQGATEDGQGASSDESGAPQGDCSDDPVPLSWENFGEAYSANWCRGCHSAQLTGDARNGAPPGVDFNSHQDVLDRLERFAERAAAEEPTMPPTGGPGDEELALLRRWIECGAP